MLTFYTHDNGGGRPLQVVVSETRDVEIFPQIGFEETTDNILYSDKPVLRFENIKRVFIANDLSLGNSILLHLRNRQYVFIGDSVFSFTAKANIHTFQSPIGNNDVPYPYAVDAHDNVYLFISSVIMLGAWEKIDFDDEPLAPYHYYFDESETIGEKTGIEAFYIGQDQYSMTYEPFPLQDVKKGQISIVVNGKRIMLSDAQYVRLLKNFGRKMGFTPLRSKELLP